MDKELLYTLMVLHTMASGKMANITEKASRWEQMGKSKEVSGKNKSG